MGGIWGNGGNTPSPPEWCTECQRYFNPQAPHECRDQEIKANRTKLEKWLGTYTIMEA